MNVSINYRRLKIPLATCFWCFITFFAVAQEAPYAVIMSRINLDLQLGVNDGVLLKRINKDMTSLNADGSWADINYADVQYDPLKRIKDMATAYIRPSNKLYNNSELHAAIVRSLQSWLDKNPKNKNWWYNDIFYPQA